ncbi:proline-rich protein 2-like [Penaeus monodon]|uniref:proline-rich protein 2-like n=1 Tax=Penaeus monodon TaxID=6687 RepID=UPI0018A72C52|nr:proline-rich protein 2-like [Penaeus monodon]
MATLTAPSAPSPAPDRDTATAATTAAIRIDMSPPSKNTSPGSGGGPRGAAGTPPPVVPPHLPHLGELPTVGDLRPRLGGSLLPLRRPGSPLAFAPPPDADTTPWPGCTVSLVVSAPPALETPKRFRHTSAQVVGTPATQIKGGARATPHGHQDSPGNKGWLDPWARRSCPDLAQPGSTAGPHAGSPMPLPSVGLRPRPPRSAPSASGPARGGTSCLGARSRRHQLPRLVQPALPTQSVGPPEGGPETPPVRAPARRGQHESPPVGQSDGQTCLHLTCLSCLPSWQQARQCHPVLGAFPRHPEARKAPGRLPRSGPCTGRQQ